MTQLISFHHLSNLFLIAHNWQKWKSSQCPCHEIYRVEAVGLSFSNDTYEIQIFVKKCEIWDTFEKIWYFVNNCLIKPKSFCTLCDTYSCDYLPHTTFSFLLFSVKYRCPVQILHFLSLNHLALLKDWFLKKMLLKRAKPHWHFLQNHRLNKSFTLIENNFRFCFVFLR